EGGAREGVRRRRHEDDPRPLTRREGPIGFVGALVALTPRRAYPSRRASLSDSRTPGTVARRAVVSRGRTRQERTNMAMTIRPLHPAFAGEVSGLDATRPIGPDAVVAIEAGMDRYAVLVFRDQDLTDEQQIVFTRNFGELENYQTAGHVRKRE